MAARKKISARKRIQNASKRARDAIEVGMNDLEKRLPRNLRSAVREMRENLRMFQQQLERARKERDERWRRMQIQMRRDMVRLLQRLEKAVAPAGQRAPAPPASARTRRKKR
jgi:predicted phage tail protein